MVHCVKKWRNTIYLKQKQMTEAKPIHRALISVSNKEGLLNFARNLAARNIEILSTGGTSTFLQQNQIPIIKITDYTGFPEIMDGRVKTLHPKIYGGLLSRPGIDDIALAEHQISPIDLVVVNLYPFQDTINKANCSLEQAIEQIDIGGPSMLRASAKNFSRVTVIVDPADYDLVLAEIEQQGRPTLNTRKKLAQKVFAHTSRYDQAICEYLSENDQRANHFPDRLNLTLQKNLSLRYGENPHQNAAVYINPASSSLSLAKTTPIQGKPLSYNNLLDSDAALNCVKIFDQNVPACAIIKHAAPCGIAAANTIEQAYQQALKTDPTSAFGGIIAFNQIVNAQTAQAILSQQFVEVIIAPDFENAALQLFQTKPSWRLLKVELSFQNKISRELKSIDGGFLIQDQDCDSIAIANCQIMSSRQPTEAEWKDLLFSWKVCQNVKSNAIVLAHNQATLGIGGGQTSRVFSAEIAVLKAHQMQLDLKDAVAASDGFFPFADGLEILAKAGIRAIIQPGGSKRDNEIIAAANHYHIALVFTGIRHFRH